MVERRIFGITFGHEPEKQVLLAWPESRRSPEDLIRRLDLPPGLEEGLEDHQKKVLDYLVRAACGFAAVFAAQDATEESSFYPQGVTREEVLQAIEDNPGIGIDSPYTLVDRDANGIWSTRPMHQVYAQLIKDNQVREHLKQAASLATKGSDNDSALRLILIAREKAFETGDFKESEEFQITNAVEPKVSIKIGFDDTYDEPILGTKARAQAWVDILDESRTDVARHYVESYLKWRRQRTHKQLRPVRVRAGYAKVMTGQAALFEWSANSQPFREEWREEWGSKIYVFLNSFERNIQREIPVIRGLAHLDGVSDDAIMDIIFQKLIYHETAHSEIPKGVKKRLGRFAQPLKELCCDLLALQAISKISSDDDKRKEIAILSVFAQGILGYVQYLADRRRPQYYVGKSSMGSYCAQRGSVTIGEDSLRMDVDGVYAHLSGFLGEVKNIIAHGTVRSAEDLFDTHFDPAIYNRLASKAYEQPMFLAKDNGPKVASL